MRRGRANGFVTPTPERREWFGRDIKTYAVMTTKHDYFKSIIIDNAFIVYAYYVPKCLFFITIVNYALLKNYYDQTNNTDRIR